MSTSSSISGKVLLEFGQFTISGSKDMPDMGHLVRESDRSYAFSQDGVVAFAICRRLPSEYILLRVVVEEGNDVEQRHVECDVEFEQDAFVIQLLGASPQDKMFSRPVAKQGRYQASIDDKLPVMFTVYLARIP